jgi:Iron-sulfur cluster-binding domain
MTISTAGFEEEMYRRVYRNSSYQRMRRNVLQLLEKNQKRKKPIPITIGLRPDRPLDEVMQHPDFAPILAYKPTLDFTWSYTSANGRISREALPSTMKLRVVSARPEPCVNIYNGPMVLPDGTVMACSCVAAMDAIADLGVGNVLNSHLLDIWTSPALKQLRASFGTPHLNRTCAGCDMYRGLELYRMREGRERARLNHARHAGEVVHRNLVPGTPFQGG